MNVLPKPRIKAASNEINIFMSETESELTIPNFCGCCFHTNSGKGDLNKFYMYLIRSCPENFISFMSVSDKMEASFLQMFPNVIMM